jgi:hypothetical protein
MQIRRQNKSPLNARPGAQNTASQITVSIVLVRTLIG